MELCVLAKIVLLLSIIIMCFNVCVFEYTIFTLLFDIVFTILLVLFTNWCCEYWVANVIVMFSLIGALFMITMCSLRDELEKIAMEEELEETKKQQK
jgi:hypothetical protein